MYPGLVHLGDEKDEDKQEEQQDTKDLHDQPAIGRDAVHVLEELRLGRVHIGQGVIYVLIDADCQLALLLDLRITGQHSYVGPQTEPFRAETVEQD